MQCAVDKGNCSIQQTRLVFDTSIVHCESCFTCRPRQRQRQRTRLVFDTNIVHCESCFTFTCRPSSADQSRLSFAAAHTSADSRTGRGADNCCMLRRKNESPPHFIAPVHFLHIKLFGASSSYPTLPLLSWKRHSYSCAMCTFVRGSSVYCVL